jgi:hypothetical protein
MANRDLQVGHLRSSEPIPLSLSLWLQSASRVVHIRFYAVIQRLSTVTSPLLSVVPPVLMRRVMRIVPILSAQAE